jgi:hypothetical protein
MGRAHCRPGRDRSVQSAYRLRFYRNRAEMLNQRASTPAAWVSRNASAKPRVIGTTVTDWFAGRKTPTLE